MTVLYTTIAPGASADVGGLRGSAVCVIDGGQLHVDEQGSRREISSRARGSLACSRAAPAHQRGPTTYREISVELK